MKTESIHERLARREPVALSPQTMESAIAYFRANPSENYVYVRFDGQCISEGAMFGKCRTRTGSLVSIAIDGIPMHVSRKHKHVAARLAAYSNFAALVRADTVREIEAEFDRER